MIRTLAPRLAPLVLAGLSVGLAVPAAVAANDSAAVVNGVVVVTGDAGANQIHFEAGTAGGDGKT
jgi:hypothetical protein